MSSLYRYNRTMLSHSVKQLRYFKMSNTCTVLQIIFQNISSVLMIRSPYTDLVGSESICTGTVCMNFA